MRVLTCDKCNEVPFPFDIVDGVGYWFVIKNNFLYSSEGRFTVCTEQYPTRESEDCKLYCFDCFDEIYKESKNAQC